METSRTKARWGSRHGDAAYQAGLRALEEQRRKFLHNTAGRRVHKVQLEPFPDGIEPNHGIDIYDHSRRLLAEAPDCWPDGATPFDIIETYTETGTLSMYAEIGKACQWRVKENKHGVPSLQLVRWTRTTDQDRERLRVWTATRAALRRLQKPEMAVDDAE